MGFSSLFMTTICICTFICSASSLDQERKVYIAYMGSLPTDEYSPLLHHLQIINEVVHPSFTSQALIRSYNRSFNGFAAYLSEKEKQKLTRSGEVISVFPCQKSLLQTTRSWDFMGLSRRIERRLKVESDIIIGVIDTGIWPESESFSDNGFGPIPLKWKGECDGGKDFVCNRKIIGARSYIQESREPSARDKVGHGTHVASILAGNQVGDASYYGLAHGVARGGVPSARLAVYKACDPGCSDTDILSAFDHAIADGVDIISISVGSENPRELTSDSIAIGAFHAIEKGILTVNAAGNYGPDLSSISAYAPWMLTVGASDTDRKIVDKILLNNNALLVGNGINPFAPSDEALPLVYGREVTTNCSETDARNCLDRCLEHRLVNQTVVVCDRKPSLQDDKTCGDISYIYPQYSFNISDVMPCPAVAVSRNDLHLVKIFKNSTIEPRARIFKSETINHLGAPFVAPFSSRGPSMFMHDIIKPDVTAPGVEILAAFSPIASPSDVPWEKKNIKFSILSGTSMACPHVTGAAAFVKSFHPEWSPSAIKSALMTTAREFNASLYSEGEFAYGSGHIDPVKATNPGLVYETSVEEYLKIWCHMPRSTLPSVNCPVNKLSPNTINYPSMAVRVKVGEGFAVSFPRTVTNVGGANSTYIARMEGDLSKLHVSVEPNTLQFSTMNQKRNFSLNVRGKKMKPFTIKRMSLVWTDGVHRVRSPVVIYTMTGGERSSDPSRLHIIFVLILFIILY